MNKKNIHMKKEHKQKNNKKPTCTEKKENKKQVYMNYFTCKFKECTLQYAKVKCNEYNKRN